MFHDFILGSKLKILLSFGFDVFVFGSKLKMWLSFGFGVFVLSSKLKMSLSFHVQMCGCPGLKYHAYNSIVDVANTYKYMNYV